MRSYLPFFLFLLPLAASAQVTVNPDALKQLQTAAPSSPGTSKPAMRRPTTRAGTKSTIVAPRPAPPVVAVIPPEIAQLPPPAVVATRPPDKIIAPKPVAGAIGDVAAIRDGIRLDFGTDSSDLNPAMAQALHDFAVRAEPGPITLDAYASGNDSDPSTPRRLSLARVLAARAILINAGIAPKNIYPRAHGPDASGSAPADRLDIVILPAAHS